MNKLIIPKYSDANSILIVNQAGNIRKLSCPFRVKHIGSANNLRTGMFFWVEEVASNEKDELIYWIMGKPYLFTHFNIKATF